MWTTFDRYLYGRYAYVFAIFFAAAMGLFAVVDGFTNLDDFQKKGEGTVAMLVRMVSHYAFQSSLVFDMVGPSLSVISVMVVLALLLKYNEFYPVLATGVPTYRLARPFIIGVATIALLLAINQELIIPRISHHLQSNHGSTASDGKEFDAQYDTKTFIFVSGQRLIPSRNMIQNPAFLLPAGAIVRDYEPELKGDAAIYYPAEGRRPAVWVLKNARSTLDVNKLTPQGRKVVVPHKNGKDVVLVMGLTFDQLQNRSTGYRYLSTLDLIHRIQHPSAHASSTRAQIVHLHGRMIRPLVSLMSVFLVIPLILRKERDNLVTNILTCTLCLGAVLGLGYGMDFLGQTSLVRPEVAAWSPVLFGGTLSAWLSGSVRT